MTGSQILFKINGMTGKSITLDQALEVVGRVLFTQELLKEEDHEFDIHQLIRDVIDEVVLD